MAHIPLVRSCRQISPNLSSRLLLFRIRLALWLGAWSVVSALLALERLQMTLSLLAQAWATTLASVLPRPSHPLARRPLLLTAIFVLTPVIVLGILVPLDLVANSHFNATFGAFRALDAELSRAVAAISSGAAYDPSPLAQLVESLASRRSESITAWRRAWIGLCALTLSMLVVFTSAAVSHFKSLGKQMSQLKARVATGDSYSKEHRQLRWAFRTLAFTVSTLWLNAVSYIALVCELRFNRQARPFLISFRSRSDHQHQDSETRRRNSLRRDHHSSRPVSRPRRAYINF